MILNFMEVREKEKCHKSSDEKKNKNKITNGNKKSDQKKIKYKNISLQFFKAETIAEQESPNYSLMETKISLAVIRYLIQKYFVPFLKIVTSSIY